MFLPSLWYTTDNLITVTSTSSILRGGCSSVLGSSKSTRRHPSTIHGHTLAPMNPVCKHNRRQRQVTQLVRCRYLPFWHFEAAFVGLDHRMRSQLRGFDEQRMDLYIYPVEEILNPTRVGVIIISDYLFRSSMGFCCGDPKARRPLYCILLVSRLIPCRGYSVPSEKYVTRRLRLCCEWTRLATHTSLFLSAQISKHQRHC